VISLGRLSDGLLDLFLPKRCVQCGRAGRWLCEACAPALVPLPGTVCDHCGAPLPAGQAGRRECVECGGRGLAFGSARAAFVYTGPARRLVTACKFRSLRSLIAEMADLATPAFAADLARLAAAGGANRPGGPSRPQSAAAPADQVRRGGVQLVTCVPVHRDRDLERGFDQAALLARRLAAAIDLPFVPLLERVQRGRRQSGLAAAARADNVRGAFRLRDQSADKAGTVRAVLVVDDVYTTGETLHACATALRHAGCEPHAFTFARAARAFRSETAADARLKEPPS